MIEKEITVEVEVESIKKESGAIVNCTLQRKSICMKEKVIGIIHVQGNENKEILIIGHLKIKDLIEKNQENGPEKEEKEIGLENIGYLHHIILNISLFLFIMKVFLQDQ